MGSPDTASCGEASPDTLETLVEDTGDLALTYTDTTAADDATHHYAVVALSLDGDSPQSATVSAATPPQPTPTPEPTPEPQQKPPRGVEVDDEEEQSVGKRQQEDDPPQEADTCAPEIESVGGSASNGNVQWKWKSVAPPAPAAGVDGCENRWVDFRLSYSDDYGATFTGAEVVRRYIHNTDTRDLHHRGQRVQSERGVPLGVDAGAVDRQQAAGGGRLRRRGRQLRPQPRQRPGFVQAVLQKPLHRQVRRRRTPRRCWRRPTTAPIAGATPGSLAGWISGRTPTPTGST